MNLFIQNSSVFQKKILCHSTTVHVIYTEHLQKMQKL